ncbi:MAG: hypothetical protein JWM49_1553 [Microbacteriaceae bacterium]|nr:hypothetical protein [Microbacteriaceae bacterium]
MEAQRATPRVSRTSVLDRTFRISLVLKGLDGLLELVGGILLLLVSPSQIGAIGRFLTQHELSEDPKDFVATHLVNLTSGLTVSASLFGAIYLLLHGAVKVVLVWAVLKDRLWAYPWMIGFLIVFIGYQIYQMAVTFSVGLLVLTAFDVFIVWLTLLEYRKRRVGKR